MMKLNNYFQNDFPFILKWQLIKINQLFFLHIILRPGVTFQSSNKLDYSS